MALNINGRMKVKTLRADFLKEFELTLRVYDGRSFADENATLASIRKGDSKGGEFSPKRNTKVGNLEDKIMDMYGIKTQVAGSDDSYLCNNDLTLSGALEEDEKKLGRKEKKANKESMEMLDDSSDDEGKPENKSTKEIDVKEDTSHNSGIENLRLFINDLFVTAEKETAAFSKGSIKGDIFILDKELRTNIELLSDYYFDNEDVCGNMINKVDKMIESSNNIGDFWKFALISKQLDFIDVWMNIDLMDYTKYISNWEDAIRLLKAYVEENNITSDSTQEEAEAFADFVVGCFYLVVKSCAAEDDTSYAEEGIVAWVSQVGDPFNHEGPIADIFDSISDGGLFDGLVLEIFMEYTKIYYELDYDSDELFDVDNGTNWEAVAKDIGYNFL